MKIKHKIPLLTIFLLAALGANTFVGLSQLKKVGHELRGMANNNNRLILISSGIKQHQLEKAILFERLMRIGEELGFENISAGRKQYLIDYAQVIKNGFNRLSKLGTENIHKGRSVVEDGVRQSRSSTAKIELMQAGALLEEMANAQQQYDAIVLEILSHVASGGYQLTFEDIQKIQKKERNMSARFKLVLANIEELTQRSLATADRAEDVAGRMLWTSLLVSILLSGILAFVIIRSIVFALRKLEAAARKISNEDFTIQLDESLKDETGAVSRAFNVMTQKLSEAQSKLRNKNEELLENLKLTDQQKRDLEKVNKELDNFAHTISHDIKSPMMGVMGYSSVLDKNYRKNLDERGKRCLTGICVGIERMNMMVDDLLALCRITRVRNPYEEVDMSRLVPSICDRLEFRIQESQTHMEIQKDLPSIICDRIKIGEVFLNLINNAIKFSSKDNKENPKIQIGYVDIGEFHEFYVRDNGIGIDPKYHAEVFGIFKRLNDATEYMGTGTGLSIVKGAVDDHGGEIWIESQLGHGATFYFTIPKSLKLKKDM